MYRAPYTPFPAYPPSPRCMRESAASHGLPAHENLLPTQKETPLQGVSKNIAKCHLKKICYNRVYLPYCSTVKKFSLVFSVS